MALGLTSRVWWFELVMNLFDGIAHFMAINTLVFTT